MGTYSGKARFRCKKMENELLSIFEPKTFAVLRSDSCSLNSPSTDASESQSISPVNFSPSNGSVAIVELLDSVREQAQHSTVSNEQLAQQFWDHLQHRRISELRKLTLTQGLPRFENESESNILRSKLWMIFLDVTEANDQLERYQQTSQVRSKCFLILLAYFC